MNILELIVTCIFGLSGMIVSSILNDLLKNSSKFARVMLIAFSLFVLYIAIYIRPLLNWFFNCIVSGFAMGLACGLLARVLDKKGN
jgi:hypothetical protein